MVLDKLIAIETRWFLVFYLFLRICPTSDPFSTALPPPAPTCSLAVKCGRTPHRRIIDLSLQHSSLQPYTVPPTTTPVKNTQKPIARLGRNGAFRFNATNPPLPGRTLLPTHVPLPHAPNPPGRAPRHRFPAAARRDRHPAGDVRERADMFC